MMTIATDTKGGGGGCSKLPAAANEAVVLLELKLKHDNEWFLLWVVSGSLLPGPGSI
jgi:hypothetical protein